MGVNVTKSIEFDAGHRVATHGSKCRNPHGHRYRVELEVAGPVKTDRSPEHGMVIDFGALKEFLTVHVHDVYDHGFIVDADDHEMIAALREPSWKVIVVPWTPTAENLAKAIGMHAAVELPDSLRLEKVRVWETPTSTAVWGPEL